MGAAAEANWNSLRCGFAEGGIAMSIVGKSVTRVDAVAKVRGMANYVDDYFVPHLLHAKILRSEIANGWVKHLDISKAKEMPGVVAIVTYDDVPPYLFPTAGHPYHKDPSHQDVADRRLLTQRVRYYGDEIAAVIAEDELTAEKAVARIVVEYDEYPPLLTAEAALLEGAHELHAGTGNVLGKSGYELGDLETAFTQADHIFEDEFSTAAVAHCALENHSAYAYIDSNNGRITVVSSTQIPHICRRIIGQALGIPWGKVRVIKPYVGGGFGGKQDAVVEPLVAFLTTKVNGRPVKLELTREETFIASRVRHAMRFKFKTGVKNDGSITARSLEVVSLNGAYASHGHAIAANAGTKFRHLYNQQAIKYDAVSVYTNSPAAGAMRGYGIPQVKFALESHMEDIARQLNLDPIEFRLKNLNKPGWIDPIGGISANSNGIAECIARGKELIKWDEKKAACLRQGSKRRGMGMACFSYATGTHPVGLEFAGARIVMNEDGSVQLQFGATEIGQGSDTALAQIAAETIGIPIIMVHVVSEQDTDISPVDTGSYASRQTYITGLAVRRAAEEIKRKVLDYAWGMTDIPVHALDISDSYLIYKHSGEKVMPLAEVALDSHSHLVFAAPFTADVTNNARVNALAYGCTFAEVEVDVTTGKVEVLAILNVHDAGKIINPQLAAGQVHGGVSMGLGYALYEQMLFDAKTGKPLNNNLLDYKLMTAMDTPEIGVDFVETYEPSGPYGNKALGEPPAISPAPAIRNAIMDATGIRCNDLPITPQKLLEKFLAERLC